MRDYELVYIVSPQVVDENLERVVEKVNQFIASHGGQVDRVDTWGKRRLAYPIGAFKEGVYFLTYFKLDAPQAHELESSLRTSEEIIRHLVVRLDEEQLRQMREQQLQKEQQLLQQQQQQQQQKQAEQAQAAEVVQPQAQAEEETQPQAHAEEVTQTQGQQEEGKEESREASE